MEKDRERWNKKYSEGIYLTEPSESVRKYYVYARGKKALDIAAGTGRNSKFLVSKGFDVDALEFSDFAVEKLRQIKGVNVFQVDLDFYTFEEKKYDLIICINFLNRNLFSGICNALKPDGILIYESIMKGEETDKLGHNPAYLLNPGELLNAFNNLEILEYKEFVSRSEGNRPKNKAMLLAKYSR